MKIVPVFLRNDYGVKSRGDSLEFRGFLPALKHITDEVYPFWFDEYLDKKKELQKRVIEFIDEIHPDIVFFILIEDEFSFETLDYLKSKYLTVNWFGDDHWRFESFTKRYISHFTYSITTDKYAVDKYESAGCKNVILSQWASFGCTEDIDFEEIKYKHDISFIGGISEYRKWVMRELSKKGIKVECFGYGWENGRVSFEELEDIFKTSRINMNISNSAPYDIRYIFSSLKSMREFIGTQKRAEQIKARNFEIPAFGGFQLTNYAPSLEDYLKIGDEVIIYKTVKELALHVNYYLNNEKERRRIMVNGYSRAKREHTYMNRLKEVFYKIKNVI